VVGAAGVAPTIDPTTALWRLVQLAGLRTAGRGVAYCLRNREQLSATAECEGEAPGVRDDRGHGALSARAAVADVVRPAGTGSPPGSAPCPVNSQVLRSYSAIQLDGRVQGLACT